MNGENLECRMVVSLPDQVIAALLKINDHLDAGLAESLRGMITKFQTEPAKRLLSLEKVFSLPAAGKYEAEYLGARLFESTLPAIFAHVVDLTADVAPEALDKLAAMRARKRRFVARNPEAVHPGRQDLAVMRTKSGWWISKNIGQEDLKRALHALALASGLTFGDDIKFPL